jgi:ribonuclease VapC
MTVRVHTSDAAFLSMVEERYAGFLGLRGIGRLRIRSGADTEPVTVEQAHAARQAFLDFGKSRHAAGLNFGDCFSSALAKVTGEPLLFKGDDFNKTDILTAL